MRIEETGCKRSMMLQVVIRGPLAALIMAASASTGQSASLEWKPEKNVEFVVGSGAGGGSDLLVRRIQALWQTKGIVKPSITVTNKPGSVAMFYMNQQAGNGHYLMIASTSFLTNHITGITPLKYTDFTPIAALGEEPIIYSVNAESQIKTGKDLVEQLKKDPRSLSIGIAAARGNHNHIAVAMVMREAGGDVKNMKIVIFDSSARGMTALMGGHVDLIASSVDSVLQHIQTGRVRAIAIASEKRLRNEVSVVPTWREQGINAVASDIRFVVAPKGMSEAQIAYWDDVFARTTQLDEWKKFEQEGFSEPFHKNSKESNRFLEARYAQYRAVLTDLGLAKE